MTLKKEINGNTTIIKSYESEFKSPYCEKEKEIIIDIFRGNRNITIFNGINVRLDSIKEMHGSVELQLSKTFFYDLVTTNLLINNYDSWIEKADKKKANILAKEKNLFDRDGSPHSLEELLLRDYLSNAIAVSVLIYDEEGYYLFTTRNSSVAISSSIASVSATGAVDDYDFNTSNPIISCVKREVEEELGLVLEDDQVKIKMIVAGEKKLQPIVLCDVKVKESISDIVKILHENGKYLSENLSLNIVPRDELSSFLKHNELTEAATEHVLLHASR